MGVGVGVGPLGHFHGARLGFWRGGSRAAGAAGASCGERHSPGTAGRDLPMTERVATGQRTPNPLPIGKTVSLATRGSILMYQCQIRDTVVARAHASLAARTGRRVR